MFPRGNIVAIAALALMILTALPAKADRISATITITNAPTTNGMNIVIATTSSSTRTWTSVVATASIQIATNATATGSATNLFTQLVTYVPARAVPRMTSPTNIVLDADNGVNLTVTLSVPAGPPYGSVTYSTQTVSSAYTVRVPNTVEAATMRTNIASQLVAWMNLTAATQQLAQASPAMAQLVGLTNNQTITGNKTMTGTNVLGYISTGTNGVLQSTALVNPGVTNATSISGNLDLTTNGTLRTPIAISLTTTNFEAHGVVNIKTNLDIDGVLTFAGAASSISSGVGDYFIIDPESTDPVYLGLWGGVNGVSAAAAQFTNTLFVGTAYPTNLAMQGPARFATTNTFPAGSDIAFGRYAITSLANGINDDIVIGTNVNIYVSGPTADFSIRGLNGSPNRDGKTVWIEYDGAFNLTVAVEGGAIGNGPTAANRITSNTGADRVSTTGCSMVFRYNASTSRWKLIGFDP